MRKLGKWKEVAALAAGGLLWASAAGLADDTCMFAVTADDIPPNIVVLLDNGAVMEQIHWHGGFDNATDFTPNAAEKKDVVLYPDTGNGFFNEQGYGIVSQGGRYYLVQVQSDLTLAGYSSGLQASVSDTTNRKGTWTIKNRTLTLPAQPSAALEYPAGFPQGLKDNAVSFRYSKNYLNWLFFSGLYTGNGADLPVKSRFYHAKAAIISVARLTANRADFSIYNFTSNASGASNVQPLGPVVNTPLAVDPQNNTLNSSFVNNVNNMGTVTYSPLAEGLAQVGGYYASPSSNVLGEYCQKSFVLVVSPGLSSQDQQASSTSWAATLADHDGDGQTGGIGEGYVKAGSQVYPIPVNYNGSTYLDDVAHYLHTHDVVGYQPGFQNVSTYTVGFMGDQVNNLFLINTSNNGNGNPNLYDTGHREYGRYHFTAESPEGLSAALLGAVSEILSATSTFAAPVVPVTRTLSGNRVYLGFFKPSEDNFWEGNLTKFGISASGQIVDQNGSPATWPNGAMREDAVPYWATKGWADPSRSNYVHNAYRTIYTHLGLSADLTDFTNAFSSANAYLTAAVLGNPTRTITEVIQYVRGADILDEDGDGNTAENRSLITGSVLHSEPAVVQYDDATRMIYFGANDGMLHAVSDADGREAWAFIPPDQLRRLRLMLEGVGHTYYVDASPRVFVKDVNANGVIELDVDSDGDGDVDEADRDRVVLVCGSRKGGRGYFALDVTNPAAPAFLWRINARDDAALGEAPAAATPMVVAELGESWSEPQFGTVRTAARSTGDPEGSPVAAYIIGGGYRSDHSAGKAVVVGNVLTGQVLRVFKNNGGDTTAMNYSIPSAVSLVDADGNGFLDKLYVGDLGSQLWRIGRFTDAGGTPLAFPMADENIHNWKTQPVFLADAGRSRKFFYPPSVTLEKGYDLVFTGSGDREDACSRSSADRIYALRDAHLAVTYQENDLVDLTDPASPAPDLSSPSGDVDANGRADQGWYVRLVDASGNPAGEKVLAEGTVYFRTFYVTTFAPNDDPCLPGGEGRLYALAYKSAAAVLDFGGTTPTRWDSIGGGIPSKPVPVITEQDETLLITVGSTNPDPASESFQAGILSVEPKAPALNFFYLWWKQLN